MKKDISASLYQKCLILCSKILLNMLHTTDWTVLLPWQHTGFQTSPILKGFSGHLGRSILTFANGASYVWSSKHMNMSLCHHLMFFLCWKSQTDWNKVGGDWKGVHCHGNIIFIVVGVFPLELLAYQVSMVCDANSSINIPHIILGGVYDVISHLICIFCVFFTNISGTTADICKR